MVEVILPAKLIAVRDGAYTMYVFKNTETNEFVMCTKLPNWQTPEVFVGNEGFLQIEKVKAGEEYFDVNTLEKNQYRYSNIYFKNFINKIDTINSEIIL